MNADRAFYIVQGGLQVFERSRSGSIERRTFSDSDDGIQDFDRYLKSSAGIRSLVIVDVIEEVFSTDSLPNLRASDRNALLQRRVQRKFPRTPYRLPVFYAGKSLTGSNPVAVYSAISNNELLDPWITVVMRHQTPLTGIHSVPLMAPDTMGRIFKTSGPRLYLSQHQGDKLRQAFVQNRLVKSARLSQSPLISSNEYPQFVVTEIQRSRRYLERGRLLSSMEQLDVCMIVERQIAEKIINCGESDSPIRIHFLEPKVAAKRLRVKVGQSCRLESLYVDSALRIRPKQSYAVSGEDRYWRMGRVRRSIIAGAFATAAACSVFAGVIFGDSWRLYRASENIDAQVTQLSEAYRRENENLAPIKAGSYEMKLAVDTGDYILRQRVPAPWVMHQLGTVFSDHQDIRILSLSWETESAAESAATPSPHGEPAAPVAVATTSAVAVEVTATIEPFDGDMRAAFDQIDLLVKDISARTAFTDAWATEYPLDANPRASITGEFARAGDVREAQFKLRLSYAVAASDSDSRGQSDDAA